MIPGLKLVARLMAVTLCAGAAFLLSAEQSLAAPLAVAPYTLGVFSGTPPSGATKPDDLAISADGVNLWVGYGNGVDTFGKGGPSNLVEYDIASGSVLQNISIPGHMDGLKIDPETGDVWATENEDGNPTLAIVNPTSGKVKIFTISSNLITGGLDDLVFFSFREQSEGVFLVASSQVDTTTPVIVQISGKVKKKTSFIPTLPGAPLTVWNVVTNSSESGDQIGDPDSMTLDPAGELVLDNRSDDSLYIVRNSSATHPVLRVPLKLAGDLDEPLEVNDTIFTTSASAPFVPTTPTGAPSTAGTIFITDTSANVIYTLTKPYFPSNEVYTAANVENIVGLVDLNTGIVTPVVTGFSGVHGLAFLPTSVAISPQMK